MEKRKYVTILATRKYKIERLIEESENVNGRHRKRKVSSVCGK